MRAALLPCGAAALPAPSGQTPGRADGVTLLTSTQSLHQPAFRQWGEAQEVQVATWRPLELLGSCLQGTDVSGHTMWMNKGSHSKSVPMYVLLCLAHGAGRQAHVLEGVMQCIRPRSCGRIVWPLAAGWSWRLWLPAAFLTSCSVMPPPLSCSGVSGTRTVH